MIKVKRALISVSDKAGLADFVRGLHRFGVEIISTGGTSRLIRNAGVPVTEVSDFTGFPEMLDGRIKTLHPAVHAGLLALRHRPQHMLQVEESGIKLIDMVVVNLYPFARVIQKKNLPLEEAIENIDIGGPAMLRSAAKNYTSVAAVCTPKRYKEILDELDVNSGILSDTVLVSLALDVFRLTAQYDNTILQFLDKKLRKGEFSTLPRDLVLRLSKVQDLRYGENPHQAAAFYRDEDRPSGMPDMKQLHGKELSFNNILDLHAAAAIVCAFDKPAAAVIKHNNPTGVAQDASLAGAFTKAHACDTLSAFGGIIGLNRRVDKVAAEAIRKSGFMECVLAPAFDKGALRILEQKKTLRLIALDLNKIKEKSFDMKKVSGGMLLQDKDDRGPSPEEWRAVTRRRPPSRDREAMVFGWKVVKFVRSNAVILVKGEKTVGIGCGQTSRVDSARIAIGKAGRRSKGSILVSDAFLPHPDTVQLAARAGVRTILQTGGSIADPKVVWAADKAGIAMIMTGLRHFRH